MTTQQSALDARLSEHLVKLLLAHGVEAKQQDGQVLVGAGESRWARLTATREPDASFTRMHIDAAGPDGSIVSDSWSGFGKQPFDAASDAFEHFCLADFHVLLAGLWGLLEQDQVEYFTVTTDGGEWDLYTGAWVWRTSDPRNGMPAPAAAFTQALMEALPGLLDERRIRAGRVFVASLDGELTFEAMLDMRLDDQLEAVLRSVPLVPPSTGYASQRMFFLAVPRQGEATHVRVGRCSAVESAAIPETENRVWIGLARVRAWWAKFIRQ
jgi:hypothetical protein